MTKTMTRLGIREEFAMKPFQSMQSFKTFGVVVCLIVVAVFSLQTYFKRGMSGRLRSSADDIGDQYYQPPMYSLKKEVKTNINLAPEVFDRKIVRNVNLSLKVDNALSFQSQVTQYVKSFDGIVENSKVDRYGVNASGTIVFKVLPKHLELVIGQIKALGDLRSENSSAQDVTGQYVDTQARLDNWRVVRERLIKMLDERLAKVTDVLEVERELARVTGEIEAMESRLKVLAQTTSFATVSVAFFEEHSDAPKFLQGFSFKNRLRGTLESTISLAVDTFNGIIMIFGFLLPVGLCSLIGYGVYRLVRKLMKR